MPSWGVLKKTMNRALIIDGRNIYDKKELMIWVLNIRVLDSNDEYISNRDSWLCGF